jgi:hypothetical protein
MALTCIFRLYAQLVHLAVHTGTHRLSTAIHSVAHTLSPHAPTDVL